MRRARRTHHYDNDDSYPQSSGMQMQYRTTLADGDDDDLLLMERSTYSRNGIQTQFLEAKIEPGDTLQALALRFHCTVADIKRLNKIDKENEIHARKVVRIPVTVHSILLGTLPAVHKSGNSSPKDVPKVDDVGHSESSIVRNPLEDAEVMLSEKLLVASVNAAGTDSSTNVRTAVYTDEQDSLSADGKHELTDVSSPLIADFLDDGMPQPRPIRGPALSALDWSGTDCDMSWVCLFVFILALCFVIPLVYVIYLAEHTQHHNSTSH